MTSYRSPDYTVSLKMKPSFFNKIKGVSFSTTLSVKGLKGQWSSMLIIPEKNTDDPKIGLYEGWLWADECQQLKKSQEIVIEINSDWDIMIPKTKKKKLAALKGSTLTGAVTEVWSQKFTKN